MQILPHLAIAGRVNNHLAGAATHKGTPAAYERQTGGMAGATRLTARVTGARGGI